MALKIVIPPFGGNQWVSPNLLNYSKPTIFMSIPKMWITKMTKFPNKKLKIPSEDEISNVDQGHLW